MNLTRRTLLSFLGMAGMAKAAGKPVSVPNADIGRVTRLLPRADITRGGFSGLLRENVTVAENDRIQTQHNGRARVVLNDGSILNIGSSSALVIKGAGGPARAGSLAMSYGMVRAVVAAKMGENRFQIRTNTAVAGVLGTTVFVDASPISTHIVNLSEPESGSKVSVTSSDARIAGEVVLDPGQGTIVELGKPPIPPHSMGPDVTRDFVAQTEV